MRFTPASAVGVALPVACVAPPARDTRAPHARIAMRTLCLSTGARSRFGTYLWVDGRGAGDCALGTRAATTAGTGCAPVTRWGFAKVGGGWLATVLEIARRTRPMLFYQKNFDTPTGTIRAYLNIFQRFLQR